MSTREGVLTVVLKPFGKRKKKTSFIDRFMASLIHNDGLNLYFYPLVMIHKLAVYGEKNLFGCQMCCRMYAVCFWCVAAVTIRSKLSKCCVVHDKEWSNLGNSCRSSPVHVES